MLVRIYSAIFWIKGSTGLLRGEVKIGLTKPHHPRWTKRVTGKTK